MSKHPSLPKVSDLYKPTLEALAKLGGSASIEELEEAMILALGTTQDQLDITYAKSGGRVLTYRMSWARSWLKFPNFISNPNRGVWVLTEEGRAAAGKPNTDLRRIVDDSYRAIIAAKAKPDGARDPITQDAEVDDVQWSDRLLQRVQAIEPAAFERLCQRLLRLSGFIRVEVSGKSGDGGIDGVGVRRMNLISFQVLFQCKRWKGSVGSEIVRNFRGAMQGRADKGLVITTGTFTAEARREATRDGAPAIDLIDGEALCLLMKELKLGVMVRAVTIDEVVIDDEFFSSI